MEGIFQVSERKILAGEKSVASIAVREERLMIKHRDDYILFGGRFPRLTKKGLEGAVEGD